MIKKKDNKLIKNIPVVPLKDLIVCPGMILPISAGREISVNALEKAQLEENNNKVFLVAQKSAEKNSLKKNDIFKIGCVGEVIQLARMPDGTLNALVEGVQRAKIKAIVTNKNIWSASVAPLKFINNSGVEELEPVTRAALNLFEEYVSKNPKLPDNIFKPFISINDPEQLLNMLIGHLTIKIKDKIKLLEGTDMVVTFFEVCRVLSKEIGLLEVEQKIYGEVHKKINQHQKSYFLNEQKKVIEKELGDDETNELKEYEAKVKKAKMPAAVAKITKTELKKLEKTHSFSPESAVIRNYLDWLIDMPWNSVSKDNLDLKHAEKTLENSHFGLDEPKKRVIEFLAVRKLKSENNKTKKKKADSINTSTVLCLTGPPGVGKTSFAKAIAEALDRKFVRISLGGMRDVAEIRGHRRTYIGALPGRIIQALKKAETRNPVILLDEIDKLSSDFRGDPSAALLEVLDPEQNNAFNDHYMEVDIDLSDVIFICTANVEDTIHPTLHDRMEKIELSSYTEKEKVEIAEKFLIKKQEEFAGIPNNVVFKKDILLALIRDYTRESGVREFDRTIAQIMRKIAVQIVNKKSKTKSKISVTQKMVKEYLGTQKHQIDTELPAEVPGTVLGLAWTETGGEILKIESTFFSGKGDLILTGQLGDVMQESARAALSYLRHNQTKIKLSKSFFEKNDIHIHVPEGAIPKDGPSAGITMATSLYSILTNKKVKPKLAMTGEITLGGLVLPIGGLKEKLLAAHRAGVKEVIIPEKSKRGLDDVPDEIKKELKIHLVKKMDEVIKIAF